MQPLSLLGVCLAAKALVIAGRPLPLSPWTPLAYVWQDLLLVLLFALGNECLRRPRVGWGLYGVISAYLAINVPLACELGTPLTWPLLRATRTTVADSILHHFHLATMARLGCMILVAVAMPFLLRRWERQPRTNLILVALGILLVLPGSWIASRVPTAGLHRNALSTLVTTAFPRITALDSRGDWTLSPFGNRRAEDLTHLCGAAAGRNVIVIHLESTGARVLKSYGANDDPMPSLTALAREAILFENAYTTYPETIKSFFATQCAVLPALDTRAEAYEPAHTPALAELLRQRGYHTGLFHSGRFGYLGMDAVLRRRGYATTEDAGDIGGERESSFGIDEPSTVRRMLAWIDALPDDKPFLLTYMPIAGHHPYDAPLGGPFPDTDDPGRYRNALHSADAAVAALFAGLRKRGRWEQSLVVIVGDHGEAFGEHDGNFGHMLFLYEENVRVPFLILAPDLIRKEHRVARLASLGDLAPTVLDLVGVGIPNTYQSRSLLLGEDRMALFCTDYSLGLAGLRDGRWKVIHEFDTGQTQLFDLETDPLESNDCSANWPERTATYRDHLVLWSAAQKYRILHPGD